jgi:hypothetical protein
LLNAAKNSTSTTLKSNKNGKIHWKKWGKEWQGADHLFKNFF